MSYVNYEPIVPGSSLNIAVSKCCGEPVVLAAEENSEIEYARCSGCDEYLKPADSSGFRAGGI
jgi:hypothetical protein